VGVLESKLQKLLQNVKVRQRVPLIVDSYSTSTTVLVSPFLKLVDETNIICT